MSTSAEIQEVYEGEIDRMTDAVVARHGLLALYGDWDSLPVVQGVLPDEFIEVCAGIDAADAEYTPAVSTADRGSR